MSGHRQQNQQAQANGQETSNQEVPPKKPTDQKKKANNKWAWKNKPPKDMDSKEDNALMKTFDNKKYYWCTNHNNGVGMWTLHHPKDCEASKASTGTAADRIPDKKDLV